MDRPRLLRNLFVVWLLTGVWHGAAWQFIVWGLLFGVLVSLEKLTGFPRNSPSRLLRGLYAVVTLLVVNGSWVIFGARDLSAALVQLKAMLCLRFTADVNAAFCWNETRWVLLPAVLFAVPLWPWAEKKLPDNTAGHILRTALYTLVLLVSVSYLAMGAHNPFIYFNF